jgi:hypothetical protein
VEDEVGPPGLLLLPLHNVLQAINPGLHVILTPCHMLNSSAHPMNLFENLSHTAKDPVQFLIGRNRTIQWARV